MGEPAPTALGEIVRELCHWRQDVGGIQADLSHAAFHYGSACPYEVCAARLELLDDPRDAVQEWKVDISLALKKTGGVPLSLNDRTHWAAVATAKDRVKRITREAVLAAGVPHLSHVHVEMHFRPATNRVRDADNTVATMKPAIDALHHGDEHFFPIVDGDDARFLSWSPPVLHRAEKGRPPALWLILRSAG